MPGVAVFCSSIWGSYIDSLPQSVDTPLCWSEQEVEDLLSGSQLCDSVMGYRQNPLLSLRSHHVERHSSRICPDIIGDAWIVGFRMVSNIAWSGHELTLFED